MWLKKLKFYACRTCVVFLISLIIVKYENKLILYCCQIQIKYLIRLFHSKTWKGNFCEYYLRFRLNLLLNLRHGKNKIDKIFLTIFLSFIEIQQTIIRKNKSKNSAVIDWIYFFLTLRKYHWRLDFYTYMKWPKSKNPSDWTWFCYFYKNGKYE